ETRRDTLHGMPDDLTPQLPCNAVPAGLARRLLAAPLADAARERLRSALAGWGGVASAGGPLPEEVPAGYGGLFEACGWLLAGPGEGASSLLISLPRVFERLVARLVGGEPQRTFVVCPRRDGRPELSIRPDVTVLRGGRPVRAVDAKWKALPRDAAVTDDVYQAVAYGAGLGVPEVVLVYPGRRRGWAFEVGPVRVRVTTLEVAGPIERCERSGRRLGRLAGG
ncbi:MAG: 5-methylcytosine restriction system specificity protein McrC, partial [Gemmataceae bacterium]